MCIETDNAQALEAFTSNSVLAPLDHDGITCPRCEGRGGYPIHVGEGAYDGIECSVCWGSGKVSLAVHDAFAEYYAERQAD